MKTLTGVLAAMQVLTFGTFDNASAAEKAAAPGTPVVERRIDKASPELMMTGKVVKAGSDSFTIEAKGKQKTFTVTQSTITSNLKRTLPEVGEVVDVIYTGTSGGAMHVTTVKRSKSNSQD